MILSHTIYKHSSNNEWVTFVHGAGGSSIIWYKQLKEFKKHFNVLILDLRGHGKSILTKNDIDNYTFERITQDIIDLIDHLKIKESHFIGISLGSILINYLSILHPKKVKSMILGGAILDLNFKSRSLLLIGNAFKKIAPFILLYQIFAAIILPKKSHSESRIFFINEAKKLSQKEFLKWFSLSSNLNELLKKIRNQNIDIPRLYIQGAEDHMFINDVKKYVKTEKNAFIKIIKGCGHVVNIEANLVFNKYSLEFISKQNI